MNIKTTAFAVTAFALAAALLVTTGCNKQEPAAAPGTGTSAAVPAPKAGAMASAEKTSFDEVTAKLDAGGNFYFYVSSEKWLKNLSANLEEWRGTLLDLIPAEQADGRAKAGKLFNVVTSLIKDSGAEDISGIGISSIAVAKGTYRGKMVVHHYKGKGQGLIWTMFGSSPHALKTQDMLPATTVVGAFGDFDLAQLWKFIDGEVTKSGVPEAVAAMAQIPAAFAMKTGMKLDDVLGSLGGEYGLVITLDETRKITLPIPGSPMEIPEPGILLAIKVKNSTLFNHIEEHLKDNPMVTKSEQDGVKIRSMNLPIPLPFTVKPTVAQTADYLLIASSDALIADVLAAKAGKKPGLKTTEEFKQITVGMPDTGNSYTFVSQRLFKTIAGVQAQAMKQRPEQPPAVAALIKKIQSLGIEQKPVYKVSANTDEGWVSVGVSGHNPANVVLLAPVAGTAIAAGLLLPALAKAKEKAQSINCMNNLRQIGLAGIMWADDHKNTLPPDFISMKSQLSTFKILQCPEDSAHSVTSWEQVTSGDVSYKFTAGGIKLDSSTSPATTVMAYCPLHHNYGFLDGHVEKLTPEAVQNRVKIVDGKTIVTP